jgi:predicted dehydrogenase
VNNPVRVAVVGLGYWGPNLVRNLAELDAAELVAICDLDRDRLAAVGRRYPAVRTTTDFEDIVADTEIEAVLVATPVSTHTELGLAAIESGKHVFIEKPLASSTAEGLKLAEAARKASVLIMPGHTFLYSPPVRTIHKLLVAGELGDVLSISSSRVNLGLHQTDVSVVWDLAPHDFSILQFWLGETPTHVSAIARACIVPSLPDVAFINLEYESGAIAHVELSWLAPSKLRRTTIVGSKKMVVYDDTSNEPVRVFDSGVMPREPSTFGEYRLTYRAGDILSPAIDAVEPLSLQLRDFCTSIREGTTPRSSIAVGLEVVRLMEAVDRSLASNGGRVAVGRLPIGADDALKGHSVGVGSPAAAPAPGVGERAASRRQKSPRVAAES